MRDRKASGQSDRLGNDWFEILAIGVAVLGVCGGLFALYVLSTQV